MNLFHNLLEEGTYLSVQGTPNPMPHTPILTIRNLHSVVPDNNGGLRALEDISFDVPPREFVCVLGPTGSGKTTLLRILAGLIPPTSGSFLFGHGEQPSIGMVFQQSNLMPWRTAIENIKLPLEIKGMDDTEARRKAQEMIELVGLQARCSPPTSATQVTSRRGSSPTSGGCKPGATARCLTPMSTRSSSSPPPEGWGSTDRRQSSRPSWTRPPEAGTSRSAGPGRSTATWRRLEGGWSISRPDLLTRRDILAAILGAPAAAAACSQGTRRPRIPAGEIAGASADFGHRIRDGIGERPPDRTQRTGVLVVGAGIAGLSAAWRMKRSGFEDFLVVELERSAGGTSMSGRNDVSAFPWAPQLPGKGIRALIY